MDPKIWYEVIGYTGMAFVVVSFLFKKIRILRSLNLIGGILSATYGILTGTWPTAILNICLSLINSFYLVQYALHEKKQKRIEGNNYEDEDDAEE